jgi:hypothetical protein
MKPVLSAVALSVGLVYAGQFAAAAPTVTVSQSGAGNTAAAEQSGFAPDADVSIRITQTGNNNHAGGPGGTTGGIVQYGPGTRGIVTVSQTGTGNNAGIVQGVAGPHPQFVDILQAGTANTAVVRQEITSGTDIAVRQNGTGNTTSIEQAAPDTDIRVTQNGTNNSATVVDLGTSMFIGPVIEQHGEGNTVSATALDIGFGEHTITQTGQRNHAISNQNTGSLLELAIQQLGADNQAEIRQSGGGESATINQNGNDNVASIIQSGITSFLNTALITQIGNSNNATVRQVGVGFASTVSQIGTGNYANVYQH